MEKPNILLITTDTQRWDTLRCMGNPQAISPNLDQLAQEGILFNQAHTSSPACMPARCSLMSGLHTPVHGCIENGINRRDGIWMLPDTLKTQGYTNIMVGKTHFGPVPDSFDVQYIIEGEKRSKSTDDCYAKHIHRHGYERSSTHPNPIPEDLFMDAYLANTTIECIRKATETGNRPFFAFCSLPSPHVPIDPPGRWATIYDNVPLPEIIYREGEINEHPLHLRRLVGTLEPHSLKDENMNKNHGLEARFKEAAGKTFNPQECEDIDRYRRLYYGLAAYCDAQVGRLVEYLNQTGLRDNTLVIFTSDHGQQYFDHGFNDKHNYYDSTWRIPLILSMPGTLPKGETRDFAIWNDLTATILAAAGTGCAHVQGIDLFTPLQAGQASPRKCAVGTLYKSAALATERWKIEYYFEEGNGRLFDRLNDPQESKNLYYEQACRALRDELVQALLTWRSDITDLNFLINHTKGGGRVARRIASHTNAMRGSDAEERLNQKVLDITARFDTLTG